MMSSNIFVKVFRQGSKGEEVSLSPNSTVQQALESAGLEKKNSEVVEVNGQSADLTTTLSDGDKILLVKNIEGGC